MTTRQRRHMLTLAAGLGGVILFAYSVRKAGGRQILDAVLGLGWGLLPILALGGVRFVLRAEAWRVCTPVAARLRFRQTFTAFLAGDAVGNVTPFGLFASEPTKVFLTRHHLATRESVSSLAIDNLVYALSVAVMISAGLLVMLVTVPLPFEVQEWTVGMLALLALVCVGAVRFFRGSRQAAREDPGTWRSRFLKVRESMMEFSAGHPIRLWRSFALDVCFHAVAVLEVFLALRWLMGERSPTLAEAMMFESLNRVVTAVFKFVPLRVGVDEAASGAFAQLVGINPAAGVALALVRKVRSLCWMGVGLAFMAIYHVREVPAAERESVTVPPT